jgi:hypothetical protein
MKKLFKKMIIVGLVFSTSAFAEITTGPTISGLTTFKDTSTGATWLRLDNFFDKSINQMLATANAAGFTLADTTQINTLFDSMPLSGDVGVWGQYASVIGRAPNRPLIWGAYNSNTNNYGWAYAYNNNTSWAISSDIVDGLEVPNAGTSNVDLNLWAYFTSLLSTVDTQHSLMNTASLLRGIYSLQNSTLVNSLSYDCQLFDLNNICLSTGGRYSNNHGASGYTSSALLIGAYRLNKNIRLGAWVDQNLSTNSATGISLGNSKPLFGVFGAWAENPSGEGYEVKVSAGYGDKDLTVTRDVIGTSEAGAGTTRLNSQAISTVSSYGFKLHNDLVVSPYVGVQYSRVASSAYTETSTADVTAPLTYSRLSQENISILAGLKLSAKLDPKTALFGSVGIEQNVNNRSGQYSATGVDGLTSIEFNSNFQKTRATASAGIYYDLDKKQRISLSGIYREEAFNPTATTSVFATYTVGL